MEIRRSIMSPCNGDDGHLPARKFRAERGTNEPPAISANLFKKKKLYFDAPNSISVSHFSKRNRVTRLSIRLVDFREK